jgi:hypothetical protein
VLRAEIDDGGVITQAPPAPLPPAVPTAPIGPTLSSSSSAAPAVNANGETLAQAKAAVLAEVAQGVLGAVALSHHPFPPGSVTANEALDFLASLPQTVYSISGAESGVVVGPPIDTLPGYDPTTHTVNPDAGNAPEDPSVDVGGTDDGTRSLESAYRPAGVGAQWRSMIDVWKLTVPKTHGKVKSVSDSLLEVFK